MFVKRIMAVLFAISAAVATTSVAAPGAAFAESVSLAQQVAQPMVTAPSTNWYWNGALITLSRSDMEMVMVGGQATLASMLTIPGIGLAAITPVLPVAGWATWAHHSHKCAWFWISPDPMDPSDWGWYDCS